MEEEPLPSLVNRLVEETRELAGAEVALVKARVSERAAAYKGAATFFAIAAVLALAALIALLVGLILSLATLLGPGWATLIVVGATLAIAAVLAFIGKGRLAAPTLGRSA